MWDVCMRLFDVCMTWSCTVVVAGAIVIRMYTINIDKNNNNNNCNQRRRPSSSIVVHRGHHFNWWKLPFWRGVCVHLTCVCVCVFKERQQPTTMWLLDRIRPTRYVTPPHNTYWMLYECTSARYSTLMLGLVFAYIVRNRKLFDEHKIAAQAFLSQLSDIFVVILLSVVFYVVQHTAFAGTIRYHMHGMVWHLSSPKNKHEEWEREKYFPASSSSSRILPTELASLFWQT